MGGLENNDMVVISTFLDPRFKGKFFSPKCICDHVRVKVAEAAQYLNLEMGNSENDDVEPVSKRFKPSSGNDLMDILAMLHDSDDEEIDDRQENTAIVVSIDQYVVEPRNPPEADPFAWWDINKHRYVSLSNLARIILSAPPTSVPSEHLFSSAGIIYEATRNRLKGDKAEMLLFLKYILCLLMFDY